MARRAPRIDSQFLLKARLLVKRWQEQGPSTLGIDPAHVDALEAMVEQAGEAASEYRRLHAAALAANQSRRTAMKGARAAFGALVTSIDGYARFTGDRGVWARAFIAPPADPGPRPAPDAPRDGDLRLQNGGSIVVRFTSTGEGVLYEVQRQVVSLDGYPGPWATVASGAGKTWTDECPPSGVLEVRYRARAMRPGRRGPFGPASVSRWSNPVAATFGCGPSVGVVELDARPQRAA